MRQQFIRLASAVIVAASLVAATAALAQNDKIVDPSVYDAKVSPCDNFWQYVNGPWLAGNPIPPQYNGWGLSYVMYEKNLNTLHAILDEAAADKTAKPGTPRQKIGDFYSVAMDTVKIEADRYKPLEPELARIAALKSEADVVKFIGESHAKGMPFVFDVGADQDMKNSTQIILYATQSGLGLPDRDYYTRTDDESKQLRDKYVVHMANMFTLVGEPDEKAKADADAVLQMETRLANASLTAVEQRDPNTWYNYITVKEADTQTPNFSWTNYLTAINEPQLASFSFAHPKFFAEMNKMLGEVSADNWQAYFRWHLIHGAAATLSTDFVNEDFDFYAKTLRGSQQIRDRWKRVQAATDFALGEVLGQTYVEKAFPPRAKQKAEEMVKNLLAAMKDRINQAPFLGPETKQKALAKLAKFNYKIGYPDKWRDYSALTVGRESYYDNIRRARNFEFHRQLNKIGQPVDRTEWGMTPQTINAYYNPLMNEIVFPAAILQPPMFDPDADDASNYGAMGAVIGHEISHGFDDEGSQYDADGNLSSWWTEVDRKVFDSLTQKLVEQFNEYIAVDSLHVNGQLTLGENIGDLGGVKVAYYALEKQLAGKPQPKIDGFTPEQRFFLAYAAAWRGQFRPQTIKVQVQTDPHSPDEFRVLGPLSNSAEFEQAFGCTADSKMMRQADQKISIW